MIVDFAKKSYKILICPSTHDLGIHCGFESKTIACQKLGEKKYDWFVFGIASSPRSATLFVFHLIELYDEVVYSFPRLRSPIALISTGLLFAAVCSSLCYCDVAFN